MNNFEMRIRSRRTRRMLAHGHTDRHGQGTACQVPLLAVDKVYGVRTRYCCVGCEAQRQIRQLYACGRNRPSFSVWLSLRWRLHSACDGSFALARRAHLTHATPPCEESTARSRHGHWSSTRPPTTFRHGTISPNSLGGVGSVRTAEFTRLAESATVRHVPLVDRATLYHDTDAPFKDRLGGFRRPMQSHIANRFGVAASTIAVLAVIASVWAVMLPYRLSLFQRAVLDTALWVQLAGSARCRIWECCASRQHAQRQIGFHGDCAQRRCVCAGDVRVSRSFGVTFVDVLRH